LFVRLIDRIFSMTRDAEFRRLLNASGVKWIELDTGASIHSENEWRRIYGKAFIGRSRARVGSKAENAYRSESCDHFVVVPFTSDVDGLPLRVLGRSLAAYDCRGPLIHFSEFHNVEMFISPTDFRWTMVYTHEDYGLGGPYFHKREWLIHGADEQHDAPEPRSGAV
jgi:hypothetical protein